MSKHMRMDFDYEDKKGKSIFKLVDTDVGTTEIEYKLNRYLPTMLDQLNNPDENEAFQYMIASFIESIIDVPKHRGRNEMKNTPDFFKVTHANEKEVERLDRDEDEDDDDMEERIFGDFIDILDKLSKTDSPKKTPAERIKEFARAMRNK